MNKMQTTSETETREAGSSPATCSAYSDIDKIVKAQVAIGHALAAVAYDPAKYWLLGVGTETWFKLTECYAILYGLKPEQVRARFTPDEKRYRQYCDEREENERLLSYCRDHKITGRDE
jgi:hypothetical protein